MICPNCEGNITSSNNQRICDNCGYSEEGEHIQACIICRTEDLEELKFNLIELLESFGPEHLTRKDKAFLGQKTLSKCPECILKKK